MFHSADAHNLCQAMHVDKLFSIFWVVVHTQDVLIRGIIDLIKLTLELMNLISLLFHTFKIAFTSIFKCFSLKLRDLGVQVMLLSTMVLVVFIVSSSELAILHVSSDYSWCPKYFSSTMTFTLVEAISLVLRSFNLPLLYNLIDFRVSFLVVIVGESVFQNFPNQVSISAHRVSILDNLVIKINETSFNIE